MDHVLRRLSFRVDSNLTSDTIDGGRSSEINELERERLKEGKIEMEIKLEWGKGKYGRRIGIVYIDGVNINVELIEKGCAKEHEEK